MTAYLQDTIEIS